MSRIVTINCGGEGKGREERTRAARETRLGVSWWLGIAPLLAPQLPGGNREVTGHPTPSLKSFIHLRPHSIICHRPSIASWALFGNSDFMIGSSVNGLSKPTATCTISWQPSLTSPPNVKNRETESKRDHRMEQPQEPAKNARQKLMQTIMDLGAKAYSPEVSENTRAQGLREFNDFLERQARDIEPESCLSGIMLKV